MFATEFTCRGRGIILKRTIKLHALKKKENEGSRIDSVTGREQYEVDK